MTVKDLGEARKERIPPCEFCGEPAHKGIYACSRIKSITFDEESGEITARFTQDRSDLSGH